MNVFRLCNRAGLMQGIFQLLVTAFFLAGFCIAANAAADQPDKQEIVGKVVDNWLAVAQGQYERAMFSQAEKSLTRAEQYYDYLSPKQKDLIDGLIDRVHNAMLEKKQQLEQIDAAGQLIRQGRLLKAKARLEQLKKSDLLDADERKSISLKLKHLDAQLDLKKREMAELFRESKHHYIAGELEKAREGFTEVAASGLYVPSRSMTAEQYLQKIDELITAELKPPSDTAQSQEKSKSLLWFWGEKKDEKSRKMSQPEIAETKTNNHSEPLTNVYQPGASSNAADSVAEKGGIKYNYLKAVVNDAQVKAARYLGEGEFGRAKIVVENARMTLEKYRGDVEAELFRQLIAELDGLSRMIIRQQSQWPQ